MVFFEVFYFKDPIDTSGDAHIHGHMEMVRQEKNKRLYNVRVSYAHDHDMEPITCIYEIP